MKHLVCHTSMHTGLILLHVVCPFVIVSLLFVKLFTCFRIFIFNPIAWYLYFFKLVKCIRQKIVTSTIKRNVWRLKLFQILYCQIFTKNSSLTSSYWRFIRTESISGFCYENFIAWKFSRIIRIKRLINWIDCRSKCCTFGAIGSPRTWYRKSLLVRCSRWHGPSRCCWRRKRRWTFVRR